MNKRPPIIGRIISTQIKEIDHSQVIPNEDISIEESVELIKDRFKFEEDKTLMNKIIENKEVICLNCGEVITQEHIEQNLIMKIEGGGTIHWNCDAAMYES